jgi:beta-carotene/zeaxanthin 4-ketolase
MVASVIVAIWIGSLGFLLSISIDRLTPWWILPAIFGRTFIQTGLFVVAHDAIHGSIVPNDVRLNQAIGRLALMLYALLPYQLLATNHWQHHRQPGRAGDPDFHDGIDRHVVLWYLKFMKGYLDRRQRIVLFFGMKAIFCTLYLGCHVAVPNLFLFWVFPIVLSSLQLFIFGTYLPHRSASRTTDAQPRSPHLSTADAIRNHNATSSNYSTFWSFLTCYHFGYHWEHHEYPSMPWYGLPSMRRSLAPTFGATIHVGQNFAGNGANHY